MSLAVEKYNMSYDEFVSYRGDSSLEYVEGIIYDHASPSSMHQDLSMSISSEIYQYIKKNKGTCKVRTAPYDVVLSDDVFVIPDISVICDASKWDEKRCNGAPDWVIEITSSNSTYDYITKLSLYHTYGVKEYWIVNQHTEKVLVYIFDEFGLEPLKYSFSDSIPVNIYGGKLELCIRDLVYWSIEG